jgi:hypothetical protein
VLSEALTIFDTNTSIVLTRHVECVVEICRTNTQQRGVEGTPLKGTPLI